MHLFPFWQKCKRTSGCVWLDAKTQCWFQADQLWRYVSLNLNPGFLKRCFWEGLQENPQGTCSKCRALCVRPNLVNTNLWRWGLERPAISACNQTQCGKLEERKGQVKWMKSALQWGFLISLVLINFTSRCGMSLDINFQDQPNVSSYLNILPSPTTSSSC